MSVPQKVVMCRFAAAIRDSMNSLTKELELELGPGTGDLALRIGIHSGPVTAGVLKLDKTRFQLFGDTVSAVLPESNCQPHGRFSQMICRSTPLLGWRATGM